MLSGCLKLYMALFFIAFLTFCASAIQIHSVIDNFVAVFFGDIFLQFFNACIAKFGDFAATNAHQMVVMNATV